ncbi:hypothetical protein G6L41_017340 [Agrobacterium tumefaciens]|uniref:gp53-like domain-containing protein n=1 Tax=Agrobacterium tumefaciens TaxID=358 RepID=UPI001573C9C3|nr:hypothetical protein [Agrobacterium tumefaciens]WCK15390.1 hypothetical protein G6L41_017340 [Agrobacterium tumefaciens]
MAGVAYYNTGTATVAANSKTVTGTGTNWLSVVGGLTAIKAGDKFGIHVGRPIIIASVDSNTQLTLEDNWPGPAQANAPYRIELTSPDIIAVEAMRRVLGSLSGGILYGLSQLTAAPNKALTIDENGAAALADLTTFGRSLISALNSSAAYGVLGEIPNAQLPTRLTGTELDARYNKKSDVIPDTQLPSTMTGKTFNGNVVVKSAFYVDNQTYRTIYFRNTAGVVQASIISNGDDGSLIIRLNNDAGTLVRDFKIPRTGNITLGGDTVWTSGNDGASSGLDADLLDGQQGAYYRGRENHTGTQDVSTIAGISVFARTLLDDADGAAMFATMGTTQSKASPGYVKLPNGIIIQWGRNFVGSDAAITLPIAFPTGVFAKTAVCELGYTTTATRVVTIDNPSTLNSITVRFRDVINGGAVSVPTDGTVAWIAIGY